MNIKREAQTQVEIAQILMMLNITDEICKRHTECEECPLGRLGVFDAPTCHKVSKLKRRLELVYKVVETL